MAITAWDTCSHPQHADDWDQHLFRSRILNHLTPRSVILNLGAGSGTRTHLNFKGLCQSVCGIDLSQDVLANTHLDRPLVASAEAIPYPNMSFDLVFADGLFQHLSHPMATFREVRRILKPGGIFLAKTVNSWHYSRLLARRPLRTSAHPIHFRANSRARLNVLAYDAGFDATIHLLEGTPAHLRRSLLYPFGIAWERIVNSASLFAHLRRVILAEFRPICPGYKTADHPGQPKPHKT